MSLLYDWVIFLHVLSAFGFVLAHGASAAVAFRLKRETELARIVALLEVSGTTMRAMYGSLILLLIVGVIGGFMGSWWGYGWIWVSLGLLIAISISMSLFSAQSYYPLRQAVGMPEPWGKPHPTGQIAGRAEIDAILAKGRPELLTAIGLGGLAAIIWLMMFKPF